jgi:D-alanyl-D-alanine carboxypeptidase/D-alanyl-D-alanine-endopeptidase (penicillin-binding protein 4)
MDKKLYFFLIFSLFLAGCTTTHQELLYDKKPAFYTYILGDVNDDQILVEHEADVYATPASCQKTITALLAYKSLGPDFQYQTNLYTTTQKGKIHDLIISFSGDPTLQSENLSELLEPLRNTHLTGRIILDATLFKTPPHSQNIMIGDIGTSYGQPISSMILDKNLITVKTLLNRNDQQAHFINDGGYSINSDVLITSEPTSVSVIWEEGQIKITGYLNLKDKDFEAKISPEEINPYILKKINMIIKKLNIKSTIIIEREASKLPKHSNLLNTFKSDPLKNFLPPALKKSDNLVFDSLYLKMIHTQNHSNIKNWNEGDSIVKALIKKYFNIDMDKSLFVDGSGLSRYNRVQPKKLFELLKRGYSVQEFVSALPSPGELNTTLEKRTDLPQGTKAKTGSMSGISCLCGYRTGTEPPKAFVIIANSFSPPSTEISSAIDDFITYYLEEATPSFLASP